jgi:hypothetical protein
MELVSFFVVAAPLTHLLSLLMWLADDLTTITVLNNCSLSNTFTVKSKTSFLCWNFGWYNCCIWTHHTILLIMLLHSFIYLLSWVLYAEDCVHLTPGFCGPQPNVTISNGAILLLHRLYSYNQKPILPFPVPTYIILILFFHLHLALYKYSSMFLNFTVLVQFIIPFKLPHH